MVVDENYINDYLYTLFNTEQVFSVTELLFDKWPDQWMGGVLAIRGLMSVQVWKGLFPELGEKYSPQTPIDFKCGFGKEFLKKGNLKSSGISHIRFNDKNKIDLDMHFGCTLDVHEVGGGTESVEELL